MRSHDGYRWAQVDTSFVLHSVDRVYAIYPPPPECNTRKLYYARSLTSSLLMGISLAIYAAYGVQFLSALDAAVLA